LLDLILEYQVPLPFMFEALGVLVGLSLEALYLGLLEAPHGIVGFS
jgi:hypothetical protein